MIFFSEHERLRNLMPEARIERIALLCLAVL
jgi:hypothetical protein